ncbi:CAMK/CAMKL/MARK protein kinase [Spizellomyces punctatus DAOM BR117]|uniref:non-specific serine/threonine protein kinase n=1 Tax=Spizellomyces punctatus (strain DAOM BR117) TaxID=645134 RepID=A0A0L0HUA5_SPIPD|nr:CAMK/CAMKL/MARK protein kinase [Spizellomyces punctatus DAOM BR117]KND04485.1 CAMK/CAMKL/MARK protein kinase [Spizellomyces punctatus DAOM BR117]|eukprot:XP_016612524.1 CAMK/CAMKL/MARK protein kinase [Spizellomyces punctatus DAOM BR117]
MSTSTSKPNSSRSRRDKDDTNNPDLNLQSIGNYVFQKTVGEGNFAKVKLAKHKLTGVEVAIKVIDKTTLDEKKLSKLYREVRIMKLLHHPNIVKLYEVIETKSTVFLVMEYASGGELYDYLVVHGKMKEKEARAKFRQILSAVSYCHKKRVIHRDLKAENLLLDANLDIKIADFGFSNYYDPESKLDTFCGSPPYAAPELFQGRRYTGPEVDIWSLGVILYVLTTGCLPFDGKNLQEMRESVCRGKYRIPFYLSDSCEKLLRKFLVRDPFKRAGLEMLIDDPWINDGFSDSPISTDVSQKVEEDDSIIRLLENKYHIDRETIIQKLRENVYDEVSSIYYLLYYEKDTRANIAAELAANPTTQVPSPTTPSPAPVHPHLQGLRDSGLGTSFSSSQGAGSKPVMMRIDEDGVLQSPEPAPAPPSQARPVLPTSKPTRRRRFTVGGEADMAKYAEEDEEAAAMLKKLQQPSPVKDDTERPTPVGVPLPSRPTTAAPAVPVSNSQPPVVATPTASATSIQGTNAPATDGSATGEPQRRKRHNTIVGILRGGLGRRPSEMGGMSPTADKGGDMVGGVSPTVASQVNTADTVVNSGTLGPSSSSIGSGIVKPGEDNKPRSLRFTFNSNTTSSKPPDEIVQEVANACTKHDIKYRLTSRFLVECSCNDGMKFEIEICKLPRLKNLHGLRFKRVSGPSNEYKDICEKILAAVAL